jgi:hypothetical protein
MGEAQANVNDSLWETGHVTLFSNELLTKVFYSFLSHKPCSPNFDFNKKSVT